MRLKIFHVLSCAHSKLLKDTWLTVFSMLSSIILSGLSDGWSFPPGCAIIRPPRDGGIRYRGLTQEQVNNSCYVLSLKLHTRRHFFSLLIV